MNKLKGKIKDLTVEGNISLVELELENTSITVIVIETPSSAPYLAIGREINIRFKETEVILARPPIGSISIPNQLTAKIVQIQKGVLLSKLELRLENDTFSAIITTSSLADMELEKGESIIALIKVTEIMLSQN